jgi:hypothetical protein
MIFATKAPFFWRSDNWNRNTDMCGLSCCWRNLFPSVLVLNLCLICIHRFQHLHSLLPSFLSCHQCPRIVVLVSVKQHERNKCEHANGKNLSTSMQLFLQLIVTEDFNVRHLEGFIVHHHARFHLGPYELYRFQLAVTQWKTGYCHILCVGHVANHTLNMNAPLQGD